MLFFVKQSVVKFLRIQEYLTFSRVLSIEAVPVYRVLSTEAVPVYRVLRTEAVPVYC